jgi:hypothetical protein
MPGAPLATENGWTRFVIMQNLVNLLYDPAASCRLRS